MNLNPTDLQKYLSGIDYPVKKEQLVQKAEENGADGQVRQMLERLPDGEYSSPTDVSEAAGKMI